MGDILTPLQTYREKLERALKRGNATENTHRAALSDLIEGLFAGIDAINEPKRVKNNAPDYVVMKGEAKIGYIEAKDVGTPLNKIERGEQMKRYYKAFGNLILTDYLEFRWYVRGDHRRTVRLATADAKGNLTPTLTGEGDLEDLLRGFIQTRTPIRNSKELAERMAFFAQQMREVILGAYWEEARGGGGPLSEQLKGFRQILIHDLSPEQFADLYAQTLCYGLFAARMSLPDSSKEPNPLAASLGLFPTRAGTPDDDAPLNRFNALYGIRSNPLLKTLFGYFGVTETHPDVVWALQEVTDLLANAAMDDIRSEFGRNKKQADPVLHFYETFLSAYDPALREKRGVYYTPEPVVSYIVRSADALLKQDFKLAGLRDPSKVRVKKGDATTEVHRVQILDPATGTGTFLHSVINHIYESFKNNKGMWAGYVEKELIPRLHAFEFMIASYTIAHLKLDVLLSDLEYELKPADRLNIFLTNTLEEPQTYEGGFGFMGTLLQEARAASRVKQNAPVMVVLGNPPYSGHSANSGERALWINQLLRGKDIKTGKDTGNYFSVDGAPLGEKNPKWLNDDYVKFMRFAQWRIEQTGHGILAFVTNHGYLDNPTFRGMRQSLMQTFDDLYILDMHGNTRKKETAPDGSHDENVFDIMQGVAIGIFVRREQGTTQKTVKHAHLWGPREVREGDEVTGGKYKWLAENDVMTTPWKELKPQAPFYLFIPQDADLAKEYEQGWKVTKIMPVNVLGFQTHRDHFAIGFDEAEIDRRISDLREKKLSDEAIKAKYGLKDNRDWKVENARRVLRKMEDWEQNITTCSYRPFDRRFCYFSEVAMDYPRRELLNHVFNRENWCLLSSRQQGTLGYRHSWVAKEAANDCMVSTRSKEANQVFPLYLYPDPNKVNYDPTDAPGNRRPNLSPEFVTALCEKVGLRFVPDARGNLTETVGPEDIFNYIYAVFHAPSYRARYAEFLKQDFPRVPLTSTLPLFRSLTEYGHTLTLLHLMESRGAEMTRYPVDGLNVVDKPRYQAPKNGEPGRVFINPSQYFEGVPPEVWNFYVGGYQVCEKWLKDRRGRELSYDDLTHYAGIVSALAETIRVMNEIDGAVLEHGGWPLI